MEKEFMYNQNSVVLISILFVFILLAYELGYRIGKYHQEKTDVNLKTQTTSIQAGILALLALLLVFTFNMSLQRYDSRSNAVIKEANIIRTTLLRAKLLPSPYDSLAAKDIHKYIYLRLKVGAVDLTEYEQRSLINNQTDSIQNNLWSLSIKAAEIDPRPVTSGFFISSLNDLIDIRSERNAILQRHIPEIILFLLFAVFIMAGSLMGYNSGLGKRRIYIPILIFNLLIVLVVFIIIDLDRPKRGIIKVKQDCMIDLEK